MREGRTAFAAGALTAICVYSKVWGGDSLLTVVDYRPVFNLETFFDHNRRFLNEVFYTNGLIGSEMSLAIWLLLLAVSWFSKMPPLLFCLVFNPLRSAPSFFLPD